MSTSSLTTLSHPFAAIPLRRRPAVFLPVLLLALALTTALQAVDAPLRSAAAPQGIVSYELAGDVATAGRILASWDGRARQFAAFSLGLDFLYMPAYAVAIALACAWGAGLWRGRWRGLSALGVLLAWGLGLAALLDAVENVALTIMLFGAAAPPWPAVAAACALVKFALVGAGLIFGLASGVRWRVGAR